MSRAQRRFAAFLVYAIASLLVGAAVVERDRELDPRASVACGGASGASKRAPADSHTLRP